MTGCKNVIVDVKGTVIGQVCHIQAAMPDGARFNPSQSNEERRALSNLVLICANHHLQIDSKKHEAHWTLDKVRKLKADHEAKFKSIPGSLEQRFNTQFQDSTDLLNPTTPENFDQLEAALPDCKVGDDERPKRLAQVKRFLERAAKVPDTERVFMLAVIKRAVKLGGHGEMVSVHVNDVTSALSISHTKLKQYGATLERLHVGDVTEVGVSSGDEWHVRIFAPSDYLTWFAIDEFCGKVDHTLDEFVVHLKFGLLSS